MLFVELAILHTLAPHLAKWLVTGAATALTVSATHGSGSLSLVTAVVVLSAYSVVLLLVATQFVLRRDVA